MTLRSALCLLVLLGVYLTTSTAATTAGEGGANPTAACKDIRIPALRLKCYDELLKAPGSDLENERIIVKWVGSGVRITRPFHMNGPWEFRWTTTGDFTAELYDLKSQSEIELLTNQVSTDPGASFVPNAGDFYLHLSGGDRWTAEAVELARP